MPNSGNIATISGNLVTNSGIDLSTKADLVNGLIPSNQLPSYVDDVLEYANLAGLPATGEAAKIYVTLDNNKIYRWSGSTYIEISPSPGSTDSVPEGSTNLYFTDARARAAISLTTTGTSGAATYTNGVINIPQYQAAGSYLTAEADTLATVTGRGATTATQVTLSGGLKMGNATLNPSGDSNHFHFNGTAIIPNSTTTANNASLGSAAYRWNILYGGDLNLSGSATVTANVTAAKFVVGSVLGTSAIVVNGGANESQFLLKKTNQSSFSVLAWDGSVYLASNIYYSAGVWVHSAPASNNNNQLFVFTPGTGVTWYASNNGSASWNVANTLTLWNDAGVWQRPVSSVSGTTNYISKFTSTTAVGNSQIFDNGTLVGIGATSAYIDANDKFIVAGGRLAVNALAYSAASFNRSTAGNVLDILIGGYGKGVLNSDGTNFNILSYVDLILSSGSSERIRITSGGDVGIGVSAPSSKLEVRRVETVNRTTYTDILTISAVASTLPYNGHGGGILFAGSNYQNNNANINYARIGSTINSNSVSTLGSNLFFDVTPTSSGTLTRAMTIQYDGNVGIGTASPSYSLDVQSSVTSEPYVQARFLNTNASTQFGGILVNGINQAHIRFLTGTTTWGGAGAKQWQVRAGAAANVDALSIYSWTAAADLLYIKSDGNIGIGTTNPTKKLHINTSANEGIFLQGTGGGVWMDIQVTGGNLHSIGAETGGMGIYNRTSSAYTFFITNAGNVGIGTKAPQTGVILDARGAAAIAGGTEGLRIGSVGDNSAYDNVKIYYTGYNSGAPRVYLTPRTTPGSGVVESYLHLQNTNGSSTTSNNTMGLLVDGSVGIGTTTPTQKLSVIGNTYVSGRLSVATTSTAGSGITIGGSTVLLSFAEIQQGNVFYFYSAGNTNITQLSQNGANFYINATGNVGISTTSPAHKLDVVGGINSDSYISLSNTLATTTNNYLYRVGTSLYWKRNRIRSYIERTITGVSTAPADYNKYYEIGSFAFSSLEGVFNIDLTFNGSGYGQGSRHVVPVSYAMDYLGGYSTGLTTVNGAGIWLVVDAISQAPRHLMSNAANWELQMNVNNNTVQFRIVIKGGTAGTATAFVKISHNNDFDNCTYTELTGTGTDATSYSRLPAIMSGINGTSLIQNDLDVIGKLAVGTINPGNYKVYVNGGQFGTLLKGGDLGTGSDVVRMLKSDDSIAMIVRGDGNVGIGTTSPANLLTVNGSMRLVTATLQGLFSYDQPNGGSFIFSITRYTNQGTNDLNINALGGFAVKVNSSATVNTGHEFYINSSGNVGIGTVTPNYQLAVYNSTRTATTAFNGGNSDSTPVIALISGPSTGQNAWATANNGFAYFYNATNGNLDLYSKDNNTTQGHIMTWTRFAGNVGIANLTPGTKFEINTPTYATFTGTSSVARFNALAGTGAATALLLTNYVGDLSTDTTVDLDFAAVDGNSVLGSVAQARIGYTGAYNDGINTDPSLEARGYFRIATRSEGSGGVLSDRLLIDHTGKVRFLNYTSAAAFTGTAVAGLGVDSSGNIITTAPGGVSGTGTANYVTKWSDADTIANSIIFDDGTNVGVGTNAPNVKLDVNGTLDVRNVFGGYARFSPTAGNSSQARLSIRLKPTSTTERTVAAFVENGSVGIGGTITDDAALTGATLVATTSGNVGIGITAPYQALHVNGNILLDGLAAGYSQSATRGIGYGSNSGAVSVDGFTGMDIQSVNAPAPYNGNYSQNLRFFTHHYGAGTGGTPRMFIQYTGNVGIGTVTPASRLHVTGGTDSNPTISIGTINANTGNAEIDFYSGTGGSNNSFTLKYTKTSTIDRIGFIDGGGIESFVILNGTKVGVGTTTPAARFTVQTSTISSADSLRITDSTGLINIGHWDTVTNRFEFSGKPTYFVQYGTGQYIAFGTLGSENMRIAAGGNITMSANLTVAGTITEQSALRYKENIAPVTAALDKVDKLQPVSYNKKGSATKEIGLIAEDVFDIYPEFVLCDDNGDPLGIHYSRLTAVLIESVKELKKEINELKNRN